MTINTPKFLNHYQSTTTVIYLATDLYAGTKRPLRPLPKTACELRAALPETLPPGKARPRKSRHFPRFFWWG
jgi:hypothetical protein